MDYFPNQLPEVGRPRGVAWQRLEAEGIDWEGQVLLAGSEIDLAARLIVTQDRVAVVRGGNVVLELQRDWFLPATRVRSNGLVDLAFAFPEASQAEAPLLIKVRGDRRDAAALVALLKASRPADAEGTEPFQADWDDPDHYAAADASPRLTRWAKRKERLANRDPEKPLDLMTLLTALDDDDFPPLPPGKHPQSISWKGGDAPQAAGLSETALIYPPREEGQTLKPLSGWTSRQSRRSRGGWIVRLSGLALALALAGALATGWVPPGIDDHDPPNTDATQVAGLSPDDTTVTPTASSVPYLIPVADQTAQAADAAATIGVGGGDPPSPSSTPTTEATTAVEEHATEVLPTATDEPLFPTATETPPPTSIIEPAVETTPTSEPTVTPTREVVFAPPSATSTAELSDPATSVIDDPSTPASNSETPSPTEGPEATEAPESDANVAAVDGQEASVHRGETPAQSFVDGNTQFTIALAQRAESVEELTLPPVIGEEWVVLLMTADNRSQEQSTFNLDNLVLVDRATGETFVLDETTRAVAEFQGYSPAYGAGDAVALSPADSTELVLVYLVPPDAGDLELSTGESSIALELAFAQPEEGLVSEPSELVSAVVTGVIDGDTIEVESGGEQFQVRYLGVEAPDAGACYAAESATANANLIEGQDVQLERQRDHQSEDGLYMRDVWITTEDGERVLLAAELAEVGAVLPEASGSDIRYSGWIDAAAARAEASGAGMWGTCSDA